jgi:hypothetical protein
MHHLMDACYDQGWAVLWTFKELSVFGFEKTSESKNCQFQFIILVEPMVFVKELAKNWWPFGQFFIFLLIMKIVVICRIWLLGNFENQSVNGYMPRLITQGYLSLTLRTTQHWIWLNQVNIVFHLDNPFYKK